MGRISPITKRKQAADVLNAPSREGPAGASGSCGLEQLSVTPFVRILAVGSPNGDDQVSWHIVERLQGEPLPGVDAVAVSDPVHVLDYLEGCKRLVLVDACRGGAEPGTIVRLVWPDCRLQEYAGSSTHGFGVVRVLELASRLQRLPPSVVVIGVEAEACYPAADLSPSVRRALPKLYKQVLAEARVSCGQEKAPRDCPEKRRASL